MLDELKQRATQLIAEDVVTTSVAWWKRQGFTQQKTVSRESGTVGHFRWQRNRDARFASTRLCPIWPQLPLMQHIIWEGIDQERLDEAVAHMGEQPNMLPVITVPTAFIRDVQHAIADGQIAPEAVSGLQEHLTKIAAMQSDPRSEMLVWYIDAVARLVALDAPVSLIDSIHAMMRAYVRQVQYDRHSESG
ncbi:MAG: hypothetical protein EOM24_22585 [Chloroflexia bacterium]|nr:hypothetical protein [Chloroflexia bacterium]